MLKNLEVAALVSMTILLGGSATRAQAAAGTDFDYPELQVVPRASERLASESGKEYSHRWVSLVPAQFSALATLTAGIIQTGGDETTLRNVDSGKVGLAAGGVLLATTFAIEALYSPYSAAAQEVAAMPAKTPREQLARERAAEEALRRASKMAMRMKWLSVLFNAAANGYMAAQAKGSTVPQGVDGVAFLFSFAPLVFNSHAEEVYSEQENYKKRIYAPIASLSMVSFREPGTGAFAPGAMVRLAF